MDPKAALTQLMKVSKQVEAVVIFDQEGTALASTLDDERAGRLAERAAGILAFADEVEGEAPVTQVEAATGDGSVFIVREGDLTIAATTPPSPVIGLVMYDLRTCLRALAPEKEPA